MDVHMVGSFIHKVVKPPPQHQLTKCIHHVRRITFRHSLLNCLHEWLAHPRHLEAIEVAVQGSRTVHHALQQSSHPVLNTGGRDKVYVWNDITCLTVGWQVGLMDDPFLACVLTIDLFEN